MSQKPNPSHDVITDGRFSIVEPPALEIVSIQNATFFVSVGEKWIPLSSDKIYAYLDWIQSEINYKSKIGKSKEGDVYSFVEINRTHWIQLEDELYHQIKVDSTCGPSDFTISDLKKHYRV